jgi:hypothetical protein
MRPDLEPNPKPGISLKSDLGPEEWEALGKAESHPWWLLVNLSLGLRDPDDFRRYAFRCFGSESSRDGSWNPLDPDFAKPRSEREGGPPEEVEFDRLIRIRYTLANSALGAKLNLIRGVPGKEEHVQVADFVEWAERNGWELPVGFPGYIPSPHYEVCPDPKSPNWPEGEEPTDPLFVDWDHWILRESVTWWEMVYLSLGLKPFPVPIGTPTLPGQPEPAGWIAYTMKSGVSRPATPVWQRARIVEGAADDLKTGSPVTNPPWTYRMEKIFDPRFRQATTWGIAFTTFRTFAEGRGWWLPEWFPKGTDPRQGVGAIPSRGNREAELEAAVRRIVSDGPTEADWEAIEAHWKRRGGRLDNGRVMKHPKAHRTIAAHYFDAMEERNPKNKGTRFEASSNGMAFVEKVCGKSKSLQKSPKSTPKSGELLG